MALLRPAFLSLTVLLCGAGCIAGDGQKSVVDARSVLVVRAPPSKDCEHKRSIRPGTTDNIQTLRRKAARSGANVLVVYASERIDAMGGYEAIVMGHAFLCPNLHGPQV